MLSMSIGLPSVVDRWFYPWSGQTNDYKISSCCFSTYPTTLTSKIKFWLVRRQESVSEWTDMSVCLWAVVSVSHQLCKFTSACWSSTQHTSSSPSSMCSLYYGRIVGNDNILFSSQANILPTFPEHLSSPPEFVLLDVQFSVQYFVDRCLSFCTFSFGHCVVCFLLRIMITLLVCSNSSSS